jgi:GNAT superfamily N-acetyltransferase
MEDLLINWERLIAQNAGDPRWAVWRDEFIQNNRSGAAQTYVVVRSGIPVGEGTLLFSPECNAIAGRTRLADGAHTANINALRICGEYEGQGHISRLVRLMEADALRRGIRRLTIGVEAGEKRNQAIYRHWGYDRLILTAVEDGVRVYYYEKELRNSD